MIHGKKKRSAVVKGLQTHVLAMPIVRDKLHVTHPHDTNVIVGEGHEGAMIRSVAHSRDASIANMS